MSKAQARDLTYRSLENFAKYVGVFPKVRPSGDADLREVFLIDSLQLFELFAEVQRVAGVTIPDEVLGSIDTVDDLIDAVHDQLED